MLFISMQLDPLTLMVPNAFSAAVAGTLLFGAWGLQFRSAPALLWWASSNIVLAAGLALLIAGIATSSELLIAAAPGVTLLSHALTWAGVRSFHDRPASGAILVAGFVAWAIVHLLPVPNVLRWSTLASFIVAIFYQIAAAIELWRGHGEKLHARWPLAALFVVHAAIFLVGSLDLVVGTFVPGRPPSLASTFGIILFENVFYTMCTAIFMILLCKERVEAQYINAAHTDALTGANNRGATFSHLERLLERCRQNRAPLSLIMFDLDHFKEINDTHGHQVGDAVLCAFADTARTVLRPKDMLGRYGGEEFLVALPGATIETAFAIAQRVRVAFAENLRNIDGRIINATVSAGVTTIEGEQSLESGIQAADQALYAAKNDGRNRVARAEVARPSKGVTVIRVA